ncbi:acyltransferase family protein [Arthrobacter sp. SAFR-179]|uniref:acyltransferase family protein n=1 Tax=Arthrobacter sp. SAFR-179 TaxID=3387279 RepID=UPI003F7BF1A6
MLAKKSALKSDGLEKPAARRSDIQGLRAIAVAVVVLFHAGLAFPGGFVGVDVFFVISGFVITGMLVREFDSTTTIDFPKFFGRRFRRLTPALALVLLATLVGSALLQSPLGEQTVTAATAIGGMALAANAVIFRTTGGYFEPAAGTNPLLHIWSLSVEEQFYVVFPFILFGVLVLAHRFARGRWPAVVCLAIVTLMSAAITMLVADGWTPPIHPFLTSYYSPLTRAWEFGVGALIAIVPALSRPRSRILAMMASIGGLVILATAMWAINESIPFPGPATLLPVIGTALLLYSGGYSENPFNRLLGSKPFVFLGNISYSWYLWHWPAIVFASIPFHDHPVAKAIAAFLALLPALASYYWVEQPIRKMNGLSKLRFLRLAAFIVAPALMISGIVIVAADKGWGMEKVQSIQALHPGWSKCMSFATMDNGPSENPTYAGCQWNEGAAGRPVFLVGDSNASQFSGPLITAAADAASPFSMRTAGGCPFMDVYVQRGETFSGPDQLCRDYYESTLSWLEREEDGIVVISSTEGYWFEENMSIGRTQTSINASSAARSQALEGGLGQTVAALHAAGHEVLLVQALPHPTFAGYSHVPGRCSVIALVASSCELTVPKSEIEAIQRPARSAIEHVATTSGAQVLDLRELFCDDSRCSLNRDGELLYQDALHITVEASRALTPNFAAALKAATSR